MVPAGGRGGNGVAVGHGRGPPPDLPTASAPGLRVRLRERDPWRIARTLGAVGRAGRPRLRIAALRLGNRLAWARAPGGPTRAPTRLRPALRVDGNRWSRVRPIRFARAADPGGAHRDALRRGGRVGPVYLGRAGDDPGGRRCGDDQGLRHVQRVRGAPGCRWRSPGGRPGGAPRRLPIPASGPTMAPRLLRGRRRGHCLGRRAISSG